MFSACYCLCPMQTGTISTRSPLSLAGGYYTTCHFLTPPPLTPHSPILPL